MCSSDLFVVCLDNKSDTLGPLKESKVFAINVLAADQQALSNAFAKKNPDKFADVPFETGATGAPLLPGRLLGIECTLTAVYPEGDHHIVVGKVEALSRHPAEDAAPLLYFRGRYAAVAS